MPEKPAIVDRLSRLGFTPETGHRPKRCRAIIFNPTGTKVICMQRDKPGHEPYMSYPGGHLDDSDASVIDGLLRELDEELEIKLDQVSFSGAVLQYEDEYFFVGWTKEEIENLHMSSAAPELTHASTAGTYSPGWFEISMLFDKNCLPLEISHSIQSSI